MALALPAAGIEPLRAQARALGFGNYAVESVTLPLAGAWQVRLDLLIDDFTKVILETEISVAP